MKSQFLVWMILFLLWNLNINAQQILYVYDYQNHTLDSIDLVEFDENIQSESTPFFQGNFNDSFANLAQDSPSENLYPNAEYTKRMIAHEDYNIQDFPLRSAVKLFGLQSDTLKQWCSGNMISRKHVLTASHCVIDFITENIETDSILVAPNYDQGMNSPVFQSSYVKKAYFFKDFIYDIAILELYDDIGFETGWLGIGFNNNDDFFEEGIYHKFSYPGVYLPIIDSTYYSGDTLYYSYGKINLVNDTKIGSMNANAIPGESGSSIILTENNENYISYGPLSYSNNISHTRITDWIYFNLKNIIENCLSTSTKLTVNQNLDISIYPNPASEFIEINGLEGKTFNLKITDVSGRYMLSSSEKLINVKELAQGTYLLIIESNQQVFSTKFVKTD